MAAVRLLPTPRTRRWSPSSDTNQQVAGPGGSKSFECRRGDFRAGIKRTNARRAAILFAASLLTASCSEKPAPAKSQPESEVQTKENDEQPRDDEVAEDCVAFLRATKVVPPAAGADCPGCSAKGAEMLAFRQIKVDRISCAPASCEITVTLRAAFNPAPAGTIAGGLTAWISPEQRQQYLDGHPPAGEQVYRVKIIYHRTGESWRAIEFDKADPQ
jgi:hypothetical protein